MLFTEYINSWGGIKEAFACVGCDYYPKEVYEYIWNYYQDEQYSKNEHAFIDVVAWRSAISCIEKETSTPEELQEVEDNHNIIFENDVAIYYEE